jgi:hypothetical protein
MARADVLVCRNNTANFAGAGTQYHIISQAGHHYTVFIDAADNDIKFTKSTDGGLSWATPTGIATSITGTHLAVCFDRYCGYADDFIHVVYCDSAVHDDVRYRSIDTGNSDTLSGETTVAALGSAVASNGGLSITRARGGNLYVKAIIDAAAEGGFFRSVDEGANWTARTDSEAMAASDYWILLPGWASDDDDIMMFFWDASADEISRVLYDNSGDAWAETSIAGTMVELAQTVAYPQFAAAVDVTNSRNLLVAWSAADLLNADLRCWHVTESAITEVTNVVANSTDDQGLCAIGIDTDTQDWYVFYAGASDGSETFDSAVKIYYKVSTDDGATWGAETELTKWGVMALDGIICTPRFATDFAVRYQNAQVFTAVNVAVPTAGSASGGAHILGGTVVS